MADNSKIILASLKAGNEIKISLRQYLVIEQYAESVGLKIKIVRREKDDVVIQKV